MSRTALRVITLATVAFCLSGCGVTTSNSTTYATTDLTGNWQFAPVDAFFGPYPLEAFYGALSGQGANITATFHGLGTCVSPTQDIAFTGSEDSTGKLLLTSTNLPNNVATLTGSVDLLALPPTTGVSLSVTGSGPCTVTFPLLVGQEFAPATGTYAGSIRTNSGTTASVSANLMQSAANSDGQFPCPAPSPWPERRAPIPFLSPSSSREAKSTPR